MEGAPVLVIGDVMLDRFIYGSVDRISPESPVPVLNIKREDTMLGGAGNALSSLAGLKADCRFISLAGDDAEGVQLKACVEALGITADDLIIDENRPTTVKTRFLAGHQQLLRADFEKKQALPALLEQQVIAAIEKRMEGVKAVLVSDYGKGLLTRPVLQAVMSAAKAKDIPVIVDPKGFDYTIYAGASAVTPNKKELAEATGGMAVDSDSDVMAAASSLMNKAGISCVFATRSQDGISVVRQGREADTLHLRAKPLEVFDVSGAGDVVIATITAAMAAGGSFEEAGVLANFAGGIAVSKVGTTPIRADELVEAITHEGDKGLAGSGIICAEDQWEQALEHIRRWRARGLKVGFTNGCFDILHAGHTGYLAQARSSCDRLIVGLNTDASVRTLKGPERPVHDESARATVLAALSSVDMVVLFGGAEGDKDQTAIKLLQALQPDLYMKGGDYTPEQIPETPTVRSYGGDVKVLSLFEGHSTTGSIQKMRA
ncbi:MAG: D-glycero-beta-D-manno-heptose-7-phosphate kinase [Alphaproteobacteria bacterium]|nr:D-glycero-beta-D-manno-heptose-7-phosphate kinase [Alphaproteobacteria bacterium]MCD8520317.1 D-glycero-beta-D-manno-heptose-7-phosphate kinase [Alphaproteobacteria bacterium]MCD8526379.1 D-glycero-beta-D-manno-heptose-7-phosphate kinase [Alphaproteobacteria bacterium]MCD8571585.1 D-glycero-beta-D-manno-heptose-7-phosphate kinase [Alphaproteobacteria bacterium]